MNEKPDLTIISFDVGETTGVVIADVYGLDNFLITSASQVAYKSRFKVIHSLIYDNEPDVIIIEDFLLYKHKKEAMVNNRFLPVRVIGVIESAVYRYDSIINTASSNASPTGITTPIVFQTASMIKGKPPINILPHHKGILQGLKHAKDAYKHLRLYVAKKYTGKL